MREIRLEVNGMDYTGWEEITVNKSIEAVSGKYSLKVSDLPDKFPIRPGDACKLFLNGKKIMDGYVDTAEADINSEDHSITITGRDKSADIVDCSATNPSQEFLNIGFAELLRKLAEPFGVSVTVNVPGLEKFKKFSLQQESAYEAIERACRLRGVFATATIDGDIVIDQYGVRRADVGLAIGQNVLTGSVTYDHTDRFSHYYVYGQQPGDDEVNGENSAQLVGTALDSDIKRFRPLVVVAEGAVNLAVAKQRAEWEAAVRAAKAVNTRITVQGWEQTQDGRLWDINELVPCDMPALGVTGEMLIKDVQFTINNSGGTITNLTLTKKNAYLKQPDQKDEEEEKSEL